MARPDSAKGNKDQGDIDQMVSSFLTELSALSVAGEAARNEQTRNRDADVQVREPSVVDRKEALPQPDVVADKLKADRSKRALPSPKAPDPAEAERDSALLESLRFSLRPRRRAGILWALVIVLLIALGAIYAVKQWDQAAATGSSSSGTVSSDAENAAPSAVGPSQSAPVEQRALPAGTMQPVGPRLQERRNVPTAKPSSKPSSKPSAPPSGKAGGRMNTPVKVTPDSRPEARRPDNRPPAQSAAVPSSSAPRQHVVMPSTEIATPAKPAPAKAVTDEPTVLPGEHSPVSSNAATLPTESAAGSSSPQDKQVDSSDATRPTPASSSPATPDIAKADESPAVKARTSTPAAAVKKVVPTYPVLAQRNKISGKVEIEAVIDAKGAVISATAVSGPDLLREAAAEAVRQWLFRPASLGGVDIQSTARVSIIFNPQP